MSCDNDGGNASGGIYSFSATLTLVNCTISGNSAFNGGGIENIFGTMTAINSTFSNNIANTSGGGIMNDGTLTLTNSTLTNNSANFSDPTFAGGGIRNGDGYSATIINTIIGSNSAGNDCAGSSGTTSLGYNIDSDGTCGFTETSDIPSVDPLLGTLADNGGPTLTHALLAGSPAIDAGDDVSAPSKDQRGFERKRVSDIGSFEFQSNIPPTVANPITDVVADEDFGSVLVALLGGVFADADLPEDSLRYTVSVSSGLITANILGDSLWLFSVADLNGMAEVVVTATDDSSVSVNDTFNVTILPIGDDPSRFTLAFPLGDTLNTLLPPFRWHPAIDPDLGDFTVYIIRISASESLKLPIYTGTFIDTAYTLAVPLADDSLYYWSVTAFDTSGGFAFSDTSSFLLDKQESPALFSLVSPEDNSPVDSLRPVFSWESSIDPDPRDEVKYTLIIMSASDTVYMSEGIEDTTHQVSEDIPIGSYQWFVVAEDTDDESLDRQSNEVFSLSVIVGIEDELTGIPEKFNLYQNYPNPFNPSTIIKYALPKSNNVSLVIYNLMGQELMRWDENNVTPGYL